MQHQSRPWLRRQLLAERRRRWKRLRLLDRQRRRRSNDAQNDGILQGVSPQRARLQVLSEDQNQVQQRRKSHPGLLHGLVRRRLLLLRLH